GISRPETMGSARVRPSALVTSTLSVSSTGARARICWSASSTVSMALVYPRRDPPAEPTDSDVQPVAGEEPPAAEDEQGEESSGHQDLADPEGQTGVRRDRGEDHEDPFQEDRHETEHGHHEQRRVAIRRPSGESLEQVGEGEQPPDDEDEPG